MALYREDIADIELSSGKIHRSFIGNTIGEADTLANRFGVRLFRNGSPENIGAGQCIGFFMAPDGTNIMISGSTYTGVEGNKAWVQLPQGCYTYEGQFCLSIKLVGGGVTGTMRIVDGMVSNTGATGAVMPTSQVPTSAEIIAAYEEAGAVVGSSVRFDITQSLTDSQKETARDNIDAVNKGRVEKAENTIQNNAAFLLPLMYESNIFTEDGKYANQNGSMQTNENYIASNKIFIRAGNSFEYTNLWGNNGAVAVVAFYGTDGTFDSDVSVIGNGNFQSGTFTAAEDGYIRFSTLTTYLVQGLTKLNDASMQELNGYLGNSIYNHPTVKTRGMVLDSLGDSITRQSYMAEGERWQAWLKLMLGFSAVNNHGVDMSTVSDQAGRNGMCTDARIDALSESAHLITVMGGMNDWTASIAIGSKTYDNVDTSTFFGACNVMFRKLTAKYPGGRIVAFGTTFGYLKNYTYFVDQTGYKNNQGLTTLAYSQAMMESAQLNGIEHYDIGGNWGVNDSNKSRYLNSENSGNAYIHPNATGAYRMAQYMAKFIGVD